MAALAKPSELRLRVMSGVVLAVIALFAVIVGGWVFALFAAAMAFLVFREWTGMVGLGAFPPIHAASSGIMAATLAAALLAPGVILPFVLIGLGGLAGWAITRRATSHIAVWTGCGIAYAAAGAEALTLLRGIEGGLSGNLAGGLGAVLVLFAIVWGTDIGAYFVGRKIGGPKLAPRISPGKTRSGAVGGIVVAALAAFIISALTGFGPPAGIVLAAIFISIVSQLGDLFESFLKRRFHIKDSGWIIPGHGGVFDRVDGLIPAAIAFLVVVHAAGWATPEGLQDRFPIMSKHDRIKDRSEITRLSSRFSIRLVQLDRTLL